MLANEVNVDRICASRNWISGPMNVHDFESWLNAQLFGGRPASTAAVHMAVHDQGTFTGGMQSTAAVHMAAHDQGTFTGGMQTEYQSPMLNKKQDRGQLFPVLGSGSLFAKDHESADAIVTLPDTLNKTCFNDPVKCFLIYWIVGFFAAFKDCLWSICNSIVQAGGISEEEMLSFNLVRDFVQVTHLDTLAQLISECCCGR